MKYKLENYWIDNLISFDFIFSVFKAEQNYDPNRQIFTKIEIAGTSEEISGE